MPSLHELLPTSKTPPALNCTAVNPPAPLADTNEAGFVSQQRSLAQGVQLFEMIKPLLLNQLVSIQPNPKHP